MHHKGGYSIWLVGLTIIFAHLNVLVESQNIPTGRVEVFPYSPVANPKAVVVSGSARFTVLTDRIIRIEWSNTGVFENRPTLAFLNRNTTVPVFSSSTSAGVLTIITKSLKLSYVVGRPFSPSTLNIVSTNSSSNFTSWTYGQADTGNLLGTIKSLDELDVISLNCTLNSNVTVHGESLHCDWGLISKNGWTIVNDTLNWGLTPFTASPPEFWDSPNTDAEDLYFFGHGHDYRGALQDFIQLSGPITMVPRAASGIWWSRWSNINNLDVRRYVGEYRQRGLPLDIYILDMDWHTKWGWGTYTFDNRLFPVPKATMDWLHQQGLSVGVNLHDDDGIRPEEVTHDALATYLGLNPKTCGTIPFTMVNASYVYGLEDIVLKNVSNQGVDFWWIDWQQGGKSGGCAGGAQNPTIWLNHFRSTDHFRRGGNERGLILARWGGLGNHRYQVGFSGDVNSLSWQDLAFQPYFSMTATNVGYGFWSHDLVGPWNDHEMHTRWLQWGAFSGIFRTHDRGMAIGAWCANNNPPICAIVEVWKVPTRFYEANREAMLAREALIPHIYTGVRIAFETGLSIIRPMYYSFPELPNAYAATPSSSSLSQYMFASDDIMVAPITAPANTTTSMANKTVWIPPGVWVERDTGVIQVGKADGTTLLTKAYDLREIPVFIRGGAVIPSLELETGDTIGVAARQYSSLVFSIYPGATQGQTRVYEDDGHTTAYIQGAYMWTTASYTRTSTGMVVTISSQGKGYPEFPKQRPYRVKIINALPASSVQVNGVGINYSRYGKMGSGSWHYDGIDLALVVDTQSLSTATTITIKISFIAAVDDVLMSGLKGGILHSQMAKDNLDPANAAPGSDSPQGGNLSIAASTGDLLEFLAGVSPPEFMAQLIGFNTIFNYGVQEVQQIKPSIEKIIMSDSHMHKYSEHRYPEPQGSYDEAKKVGESATQRWAYSMALLANAFN